jgi:uncharacterized protein
MIAVDTNILVYAHRPEAPFHTAAKEAVARLAEATGAWAIPMHCLVEFAGVVTHTRLWRMPSSVDDVDAQVNAWLESPSSTVLAEDRDFWPVFGACLRQARTSGGAVHDTRIAACCKFHGVRELWTADRDFSRYPWLRTYNPLA